MSGFGIAPIFTNPVGIQGISNAYSNLIPDTYNLSFLDDIATPLERIGGHNTAVLVDTSAPGVLRGSPTDEILRSVPNKRGVGSPAPAAAPRAPAPAQAGARAAPAPAKKDIISVNSSTPLQDAGLLAAEQAYTPASVAYNSLNSLPLLAENQPGLFSGQVVNQLLQPHGVENRIDSMGNIYGGPAASLVSKRIRQLQGFGFTVNNQMYTPNQYAPGTPNRPFVDSNFQVRFAVGKNQIWGNRLFQFSSTGASNDIVRPAYPGQYISSPYPYAPTGTYPGSQGLCLDINGMQGRVLILERRCAPYYFHMARVDACDFQNVLTPQGDPINVKYLQNQGGMYFTTDPVGGGPWNAINYVNGQPSPPPVFPGAAVLTPGNVIEVRVDNNWPDVLFYQSTAGPFMGGIVQVIGNYTSGSVGYN